MKKLLTILLLLTVYCLLFTPVHAISDPLSVTNNKFGIHVINEQDLESAARLVNSSGGDWGYVKIVIQDNDRDTPKWQEIFDRMRRLHLIPIVRLATHPEGGVWAKPRADDISGWIDFLNRLNWVVENRYVVIFNEPNHAAEWGGDANPEEYAWYLKEFSHRLKEKNADFFILPAGLDASAPNGGATMDEATYIARMYAKEKDVFDVIDGWSSHSYPNPGFVGSPNAVGRGSIRTFEWERQLLQKYGKSELPIFILETGWRHRMGKNIERAYPGTDTVAQYFQTAYTTAWKDPHIVAVVPFLINYQDFPFDHFSWQQFGSSDFYEMYYVVQNISKDAGRPKQHISGDVYVSTIGEKLVSESLYSANVEIRNTGQSMMSTDQGWRIEIIGLPKGFEVLISSIQEIQPFKTTKVDISLKTPNITGIFEYETRLMHGDKIISSLPGKVTIVPPPSLLLEAHRWIKGLAGGDGYKLLIYNQDEELVYSNNNVTFKNGYSDIENLHNVVPDRKYRLVLLKDYYLPRQVVATLSEQKTGVSFPILLPLDPSNDGKLSFSDTLSLIRHPLDNLGRFLAF